MTIGLQDRVRVVGRNTTVVIVAFRSFTIAVLKRYYIITHRLFLFGNTSREQEQKEQEMFYFHKNECMKGLS